MSDFIKMTMGSQFVIPVYQRNYTWIPEKETARFMNDMENLLSGKSDNQFLGIIIYLETPVTAMFRQFQIIDGQQRMTTAFLFLLALRQYAEQRKDSVTKGMIEDYYLYNHHVSESMSLRLKPAISEDDVYARLVYGSPKDLSPKEKESNVYRNYDYISRRIRNFAGRYPLLQILDTLNRIDILGFPLSDRDNAQQIFESINSTGAPLTSADLIRNYILMNHTDDVQERLYSMYWKPLESYFPDSRKLEDFFRFFLAAKTYSLMSRKDVYEGFKTYWENYRGTTESGMQEVVRYGRYFQTIYSGPAENAQIERALDDFRKNDSRLPAPFLMEMMRLQEQGEITARELTGVIQLTDSYLIRRALCSSDASGLNRYFPQLLRSVLTAFEKNRDILTITRVHLINYNRGKILAMPTDDQLRKQLREVNAYSLMCIRSVLDRIEHFNSHARVDLSGLNIEHIMPQHPNTWWKENSGMAAEDEYAEYVNLIGNLTLCAEYDNSRMGNEDFAYKKKVLAKTSHIRLNEKILKKKTWDKESILKRCDELAETIIRIYPYDAGKAIAAPKNSNLIVLNTPTVSARAVYRDRAHVEVLAGSTMKPYGAREMKTMRQQFQSMYDRGILTDDENGKIQFEQNYRFGDLNAAASFLMHRGGNNASAWVQEDGSEFHPEQIQERTEEKKTPAPKQRRTHQSHPKKKAAQKPAPRKSEQPAVKKDAAAEETPKRRITVRRITFAGRNTDQ